MSNTPRTIRRRGVSFGAFAAATALLLTACAGGNGSADTSTSASDAATTAAEAEPVAGGSLVWAVETEPLTLNAQVNGQNKAKVILRNVFDSYLFKNADGSYDPWLAESYTYNDAETELTLVLKDGITFSDGDPLDSAAVVANFEQFRVEGYSSAATFSLRNVTAVTAPDAKTVVFTLSAPDAFFLDYLSSLNASPISPTTIASAGAELPTGGPAVAGTGPFVIESYTPGQDVKLTKRADYDWAPPAAEHEGAAYLDELTFRFLTEASTRTGALTSGQVDVIDGVQSVDVPLFEDSEEFSYGRALNNGLPYTYYFNVSQAPLDDIKVREAFIKGVDLDAVLEGVHHGEVDRALAPVSSISPFFDDSLAGAYETDVDAANALLDEAGWTERDADGYRTKDGARLTVLSVAAAPYLRDNRELLGQAISANLKENVGIDFQFQAVDAGTAQEAAKANAYNNFDNSRGDSDSGQPLIFLYRTDAQLARGKFNDPALDALLDQAAATNDVAARTELYLQAQQLIVENSYSLPLYVPQDTFAAADGIEGVTVDDAAGVIWSAYNIWKDNA